MRKLLFLFLILIIGFTSCEGRKTQNQALKESIEDFKKDTIIAKVSYYPEVYEEVVNDTILSNGFRVKFKYFSDMNNELLDEVVQEEVVHKRYHREFNAQVSILKNGKEIFNQLINKDFFKKYKEVTHDSLNFSIISNVAINQESSTNGKNLNLEIWFNKINTDLHHIYTLAFNEDGLYELQDVNEIEF